jgi:alkyl hydroperoxide reductase subunit D
LLVAGCRQLEAKENMTIENLKEKIGDFAKDVRINLGNVISETGAPDLSVTQIYGTALASAYATKNQVVIDAILAEVSDKISAEEIEGIKTAASVMAMNNIYYRFVHLVHDKEYSSMPANLRMQALANPGIDKVNFELYSLAVSAINGCGMCIEAHVRQAEKHNLSKLAVQSCIRIAAVIHSAAQAVVIGN